MPPPPQRCTTRFPKSQRAVPPTSHPTCRPLGAGLLDAALRAPWQAAANCLCIGLSGGVLLQAIKDATWLTEPYIWQSGLHCQNLHQCPCKAQ